MSATLFFTHFWHFFFDPNTPNTAWYQGNVWGNVVAVAPLAILGVLAFWWHHSGVHKKLDAQARLLETHGAHLALIVDALDPETDGGLTDVLDRLDPTTDGGIKVIVDRLAALSPKS